MVLKLKTLAFAAASLSPPKQPFFQPDEFDRGWKQVWSAFYERDEDFNEFMDYFVKRTCVPPKSLALEEGPFDLFVCAERCSEQEVAALVVTGNGTRIRYCVRAPSSALEGGCCASAGGFAREHRPAHDALQRVSSVARTVDRGSS